MLTPAGGSALTWVALVIFGLGMRGVGALGPLVITEMFGLRSFGSIPGFTRPATTIPVVPGPIMTPRW